MAFAIASTEPGSRVSVSSERSLSRAPERPQKSKGQHILSGMVINYCGSDFFIQGHRQGFSAPGQSEKRLQFGCGQFFRSFRTAPLDRLFQTLE